MTQNLIFRRTDLIFDLTWEFKAPVNMVNVVKIMFSRSDILFTLLLGRFSAISC